MGPVVQLLNYARQPAGSKHCCQSGLIDWLHWFLRGRDDEISGAGRPVCVDYLSALRIQGDRMTRKEECEIMRGALLS